MEVKEYLDNAKDNMDLAVEYLDDTLSHIRPERLQPVFSTGYA